jgi:hypothetical protein
MKKPHPKVPKRRGRTVYPWETLPEGQSFAIVKEPGSPVVPSVRAMASRAGARLKKQFAVRDMGRVIHVWRVR